MKRTAALAGIACALAVAPVTSANAAQIRFLGAFTVTSISHCLARYVGENFNSSYRLASLADNPDVTSISQLNQYSGDVYELPAVPFPTNQWVSVEAHGFDNVHYAYPARIKITAQPAAIGPTTNTVALTGYIDNM